MKTSDLILVNHAGEVVYGAQPVNRAAFVLHAAIHKARPDVIGAAHAHSTYGKAWSALGRKLDPITQDSCIFYDDHVLIAEQGGAVVFEETAAEEIISKFPTGKAAIHQNHGLFTVGTTVEAAAFWFITMDRSCQAQLLAEAAGTPKLIPHDMALYTQQLTGFADAGWFQFQPLFQEICASDPDLFE
jgi:ribulose-5-phosphate 4-epimerase/fuculose-1-phosphate aldolase